MKKLLLTAAAAVVFTTGAFAGTGKTFKEVEVVEPSCRFRDMEFQVDAFYSGIIGTSNSKVRTGSGGGVGLNFFFAKYFGIGAESFVTSSGQGEWFPAGGNFFFRYPICSLNLAPYVMVGGGVAFDGYAKGYGNVGAGLEYRFTDHIGLFADGRYLYGGTGNLANVRTGLRFAF
jgi:hypothetical protein